jgi:hypothetical protein
MGLLALKRVMSMQQDRRRRQIQSRSKPPVASVLFCFAHILNLFRVQITIVENALRPNCRLLE